MHSSRFLYTLSLLVLLGCGSSQPEFDKSEFRRAKLLCRFTGMANELEDANLELRANGYFAYYSTLWLGVTIKQATFRGRYFKQSDTIYLNWIQIDPKSIKPYLSRKCLVDSNSKRLWFVDEQTGERFLGLHLSPIQ